MTSPAGSRPHGLWDPTAEALGRWDRPFWIIILVSLLLSSGPPLLHCATDPSWYQVLLRRSNPDFFQDYASARNHFNGLDPYAGNDASSDLYLDRTLEPGPESFKVNAHPPTSIILFLPLATLDFSHAFLVWNFFSSALCVVAVALIVRQLGIPCTIWSFVSLLSLFLLSGAVRDNLLGGQCSFVLLYLVVIVWAADRSGHPLLAGGALALAVSLKLFPCFLFVYFLARRRWSVVWSGILGICLVCSAAAAVMGIGVFREYALEVCPRFAWYVNAWTNSSIPGFLHRLTDTAPAIDRQHDRTTPLVYCPEFAWAATSLSCVALLFAVVRAAKHAATRNEQDMAFALAVCAMLLLNPITWPSNLLLLVVPFTITWREIEESDRRRWFFCRWCLSAWSSRRRPWTGSSLHGTTRLRLGTPSRFSRSKLMQYWLTPPCSCRSLGDCDDNGEN